MEIEIPNIPHIPDKGTHMVYFDPSDLYIDASDFKEVQCIHIIRTCSSCFVCNPHVLAHD